MGSLKSIHVFGFVVVAYLPLCFFNMLCTFMYIYLIEYKKHISVTFSIALCCYNYLSPILNFN